MQDHTSGIDEIALEMPLPLRQRFIGESNGLAPMSPRRKSFDFVQERRVIQSGHDR